MLGHGSLSLFSKICLYDILVGPLLCNPAELNPRLSIKRTKERLIFDLHCNSWLNANPRHSSPKILLSSNSYMHFMSFSCTHLESMQCTVMHARFIEMGHSSLDHRSLLSRRSCQALRHSSICQNTIRDVHRQ